MTREAKLQIERKVVEVLGELYGQYQQLSKIDENLKDWVNNKLGISLEKEPVHDAAGINDDWPVGRGIFVNDQKSFIVLVNFEDHLQMIVIPDEANSETLKEGIGRLLKLIQTFEKLEYATDPYLGHLTVSPSNLGTSMFLEGTLTFEFKEDGEIDKDLADEILYNK